MFELIGYATMFVMGWITKWAWDRRYRAPKDEEVSFPVEPVRKNEEPYEFPNYKNVNWE